MFYVPRVWGSMLCSMRLAPQSIRENRILDWPHTTRDYKRPLRLPPTSENSRFWSDDTHDFYEFLPRINTPNEIGLRSPLKPRLHVTCYAEALARGQLAELNFWKFRKVFPYQSNSQNFFKFYCHFLGRRARGVFPVPLASRKSFEVLLIG